MWIISGFVNNKGSLAVAALPLRHLRQCLTNFWVKKLLLGCFLDFIHGLGYIASMSLGITMLPPSMLTMLHNSCQFDGLMLLYGRCK